MPFAPKNYEDLRQPTPQDAAPVHAGMAAGAERRELGVVVGAAVMHIQIVSGLAAAASPAVAIESGIPVASEETRRIPPAPVTGHAQARRPPLFPARRSRPATLDPPPRPRAAGPG